MSMFSLIFMKIFLLDSLFIGHDSGLWVAKTPNNIEKTRMDKLLNLILEFSSRLILGYILEFFMVFD